MRVAIFAPLGLPDAKQSRKSGAPVLFLKTRGFSWVPANMVFRRLVT